MNKGPFRFSAAGGADDPLEALQHLPQGRYLRRYLKDLGVKSVLEEPRYFDRDYLSEFKAFYCTSSAGYSNCCRRLHYFSAAMDRELFQRAAGGDVATARELQDAYLGFIVLRPVPGAPVGRTVLRSYTDPTPELPRVTEPARRYSCHVAGIELSVAGLAWQQQDTGVGACATIALWSMLHSSAFDDRHVVPTTAEVTQLAHQVGFSSRPQFPSRGLMFPQLEAAVRDSGLTPLVIGGRLEHGRFERAHFAISLASFVRSGYPVLIAGRLGDNGGHAVCAVGFRQASVARPLPGKLAFEDEGTRYVYIHDDNVGPAARFEVVEGSEDEGVRLCLNAPPSRPGGSLPPANGEYPCFRPTALLAATHDDVRVTPYELHRCTLELGAQLITITGRRLGLIASSRITQLSAYVGMELARMLGPGPRLAKARLALSEDVRPMSRHLGIIRFGDESGPLVDILYDTTDSVSGTRAFCHVVYDASVLKLTAALHGMGKWDAGVAVEAF